jgi:hypothetical protein
MTDNDSKLFATTAEDLFYELCTTPMLVHSKPESMSIMVACSIQLVKSGLVILFNIRSI